MNPVSDSGLIGGPVLVMLALPLLAALMMLPVARWWSRGAAMLGPAALIVCVLIGLSGWMDALAQPALLVLGSPGAPLQWVLRVDGLGILLASLGQAAVLVYWSRGEDHPQPMVRDAAKLLLASGVAGIALSGNWLGLWLSLELCTAAVCAALVLPGTLRANVAMLDCLRFSVVGFVLALAGFAGLGLAGVLEPTAVAGGRTAAAVAAVIGSALVVLGFGAKALLFPLNNWMFQAAKAGSGTLLALVSGVLPMLVLIGIARILAPVVELHPASADPLLLLGGISVILGSLGMWRAAQFRLFLLQFSIASAGLAAIALAVSGDIGFLAALAVLGHFLLIHSLWWIAAQHWRRGIAELSGIAWRMPIFTGLLAVFVASLVGIPPLPGFWVKLLVFMSCADRVGSWGGLILAALIVATVVQAAAWLRLFLMLYARQQDRAERADGAEAPALPRADLLPELLLPGRLDRAYAGALFFLLVLATVMIAPLSATLNQVAEQAVQAVPASQRAAGS